MEEACLYSWENDVNCFFIWIEQACGIHKDNEKYKTLNKLVKSQIDLDNFIDNFDGNLNMISTINKLMKRKIAV